jgi:S-DNA-T family DNA segregation ATPase FtsK/SpoIIIE
VTPALGAAVGQVRGRRSSGFATFVSGWGVELVLVTCILVCAFTLVSLVGFHPADPTFVSDGPGRAENPCGMVGATLAAAIVGLVGYGAWVVLVPATLCGLALAGREVFRPLRWAGWASLYTVGLAVVHLLLRPGTDFGPGGAVGRVLAELLEALVGAWGAWIVLLGTALLLITVLTGIEWSAVLARIVDAVEARWPAVREALANGGKGLAGLIFGLVAALAGMAWAAALGLVHVAWAGTAASVRGLTAAITATGRRFRRSVRRMGDSLVREDHPYPELALATASGASYLDADDDSSVPPDPTPTAPAMRRGLAEVEWEPTAMDGEAGDDTPAADAGDPVSDAPIDESRSQASDPSQVLQMFPDLEPRRTTSDPGSVARRPVAAEVSIDDDDDDDHDDDDAEDPEADDAFDAPEPVSLGVRGPVVVHKNAFLDSPVDDDGGAVVVEARAAEFHLPTLSLLDEVPEQKAVFDDVEMRRLAALVEEKLLSFKIGGQITGVRPGPVVTIFEFMPEPGVKVSRIAALADDLAMALKAQKVRIVAPIPGKGVVGIEIPSPKRLTIYLRELLANEAFRATDKALPCVIGKDSEGRPLVADLAKMPHLLIGGTTGSGKSVGVNGMLMSLLYTRTPEDLRFLLIDPKKLEFELYHDIPHLLYPIMTQPKEASAALAWACREMDDRYEILARWGVRNIVGFNQKVEKELQDWTGEKARKYAPKGWTELDGPLTMPKKLPYIVIIIDELADLMMVAGKEVEESICRIAQKARACGIHLLVATQRPSVDVVTGLIKANLPTRIAYTLRTRVDSRTILDEMGAESLLGRGDCLYLPPGEGSLIRAHAAFVSDEEVGRVTDYLRDQKKPEYVAAIVQTDDGAGADAGPKDELYDQAVRICVQLGKASTSLVQRHLKIGYNRAANIIEQMEAAGVVGPADGAKPREVLISAVDLPDED